MKKRLEFGAFKKNLFDTSQTGEFLVQLKRFEIDLGIRILVRIITRHYSHGLEIPC